MRVLQNEDRPPCVGTYEADHEICNGNPRGKTSYEQRACAWRDRCVGLQAYAQEYELSPLDVAASQDPKSLEALCVTYVERYSIKEGVIGALPEGEVPALPPPVLVEDPDAGVEDEPGDVLAHEGESAKHHGRGVPRPDSHGTYASRRRRKAAKKAKRRKKGVKPSTRYTVPLNDEVLGLGAHFERHLKKLFAKKHRVRSQRSKRVLARPGTIYAIDRTNTSRYVSWYCLQARGRDQAIACVRFKPALQRLDIEVPVDVDDLRAVLLPKQFKRLRVRPLNDGQFHALCTHLDHEATALVVEALAKLVANGKLELSASV